MGISIHARTLQPARRETATVAHLAGSPRRRCDCPNTIKPFGTREGLTGNRPPVYYPALTGQRDLEPGFSKVPSGKQSQQTTERAPTACQSRTFNPNNHNMYHVLVYIFSLSRPGRSLPLPTKELLYTTYNMYVIAYAWYSSSTW